MRISGRSSVAAIPHEGQRLAQAAYIMLNRLSKRGALRVAFSVHESVSKITPHHPAAFDTSPWAL